MTNRCGDRIAQHNYYPFGEEATYPYQDTERMKFTGQERDLNLTNQTTDDLDYMHARYYAFNIGRFMSVDPVRGKVGSSQSWNRYSYVKNQPLAGVDRNGKIGPGPAFSDMLTVWAMGRGTQPEDRLKMYLQIQRGRQRAVGFDLQIGATAALTVFGPEFLAPRLASLGIDATEAGLRSQAIVGAMAGFFSAHGERRATGALAGASLGLIPLPTADPVANGLSGFLGNSAGQVISPPRGGFSFNLASQAALAGAFATIPTGFSATIMSPAAQRTVLPGLNAGIQAAMQHLVNTSWRERGIDDATAASTVVRCGNSYKFLNDCSQ